MWYPWEGLVRLGETLTLTTLAAAVTATALVFRRAESPKDAGLRVVALFSVITLAVLGLSSVELQWRYVLLASPPVFLLSAQFIESAGQWLVRRMPFESSLLPRRAAAAIVSVALVIAFIGDQYLGVLRASDSLPAASRASMFAPPTDTRWRADLFLANVEPGDRVICNDELACQFLAGRVDYWLLPSARIVERYTAAGVEGRRGFYAGAKVVTTGQRPRAHHRMRRPFSGPPRAGHGQIRLSGESRARPSDGDEIPRGRDGRRRRAFDCQDFGRACHSRL